ncbi:heavy-metal-associated domain-containing protein [Limosilactobacillus alvi]|nr:cation transporter [Limosilactobacillus alvi]
MQKITMAVDQLTCPSCLTKIQTALDQQTTVTSSKVLFNAGKVKLTATDDANPNEFKKIVEQLGYPVTNLKVKELA